MKSRNLTEVARPLGLVSLILLAVLSPAQAQSQSGEPVFDAADLRYFSPDALQLASADEPVNEDLSWRERRAQKHADKPLYTPHAEPDFVVDRQCQLDRGRFTVDIFKPATCGEDRELFLDHNKLIMVGGFGVMYALYLMPPEYTNWDPESREAPLKNWVENVQKGPVWDEDPFWINYIGHPYFGGVYYQAARAAGYNQWNSFVYTALMSTFYWEYGLEAFYEIPSLQDMFVTPIGGALWGEFAFQKKLQLKASIARRGEASFLDKAGLFVLDPIDSVSGWINYGMGYQWIKRGTVGFTSAPPVAMNVQGYQGLQIQLEF